MLPKKERPLCLVCKARAVPGVVWCHTHAIMTKEGREALAKYKAEKEAKRKRRAEKRQKVHDEIAALQEAIKPKTAFFTPEFRKKICEDNSKALQEILKRSQNAAQDTKE